MIRALPDTNVLISSVFWSGKPNHIIKQGIEGKYQLVTSVEMLQEFVNKMRNKFGFPEYQLYLLMDSIFTHFHIVPKISSFSVVRDPTDNKVIETAFDGQVDYIITGDPDLLDLKEFRGIKIVNPDEFLKTVG